MVANGKRSSSNPFITAASSRKEEEPRMSDLNVLRREENCENRKTIIKLAGYQIMNNNACSVRFASNRLPTTTGGIINISPCHK